MPTEPEAANAPEPAAKTDAAGVDAGPAGVDDAAIETIMIPQIEIDARVAESLAAADEPDGSTRLVPDAARAAGAADAADGTEVEEQAETVLRSDLIKEESHLFVSRNRAFAPEPDVAADPDLASEAETEMTLYQPVPEDEPAEDTVVGVGPFVVQEQAGSGIEQPNFEQPRFEQPTFEQPNFEQPGFGAPAQGQPGLGQPDFNQPDHAQPDYAQPVPAERQPLGKGAKVAAAVAGGFLLVAFGGWATAYALAGDKIAAGTMVGGVEVGDMTAGEATALLEEKFAPAHSQPIKVTAGGKTTEVNPAEAGLQFDAAATIEKAEAAHSWSPLKLWRHFTAGGPIEPVIKSDEKSIAKIATKVNKGAGTPFKNGDVVIKKGKIKTTQPVAGKGVSDTALTTALTGQLLVEGDREAEVALEELTPDIDEADVKEAVDKVATPAVSAPITLRFEKTPVELGPKAFGEAIRFDPKDGELAASVAPNKLRKVLKKALAGDADKPVDATVKLVGGKPKIVPAKPGVTFNQKDVEAVFLDVVTTTEGERVIEVTSKVAKPKVTTEDVKAWGVKEKISSFTTNYPFAEYRNVNIGRAAQLVNGTVLAPGDTFSLNDTVGERTAANGFTKGWMIQNGVFREDYGGGVSQMATTTFNAMFFAGLQDVEHKAHSLYISRYPIGREATVAWPSLDLRFKNNTDYGVLIHSWINPAGPGGQGSVTVEMWSTKIWDVKTRTGDRYDFKPPSKQKITDGNCENTVGAQGFSINVWRDFYKPGSGSKAKTETFKTTYIPQDEVVCTDESAKPPPADPN